MNNTNELTAHLFAIGETTSDCETPTNRKTLSGEQSLTPSMFVPFQCSMETLAEHLLADPSCYFEWDGSFSMSGFAESWERKGSADNPPVMCGMIYDSGGSIQRLELSGGITAAALTQLVQWLSVPPEQIAVQQLPTGKLSTFTEFKQLVHASQQ